MTVAGAAGDGVRSDGVAEAIAESDRLAAKRFEQRGVVLIERNLTMDLPDTQANRAADDAAEDRGDADRP